MEHLQIISAFQVAKEDLVQLDLALTEKKIYVYIGKLKQDMIPPCCGP